MNVKYSKDVDILMIELSKDPIVHAEKKANVIVHFNKKDQPVALEILDAKNLLQKTFKALPHELEKQIVFPPAA